MKNQDNAGLKRNSANTDNYPGINIRQKSVMSKEQKLKEVLDLINKYESTGMLDSIHRGRLISWLFSIYIGSELMPQWKSLSIDMSEYLYRISKELATSHE
jgi:hypothetical protein